MNTRKFAFALYAGIFIAIITFAIIPFAPVQASCGVGGVACPSSTPVSSGIGSRKQKPPILPINTPTPTATINFIIQPPIPGCLPYPACLATYTPTPNIFQTFTVETLTAEARLRAPAPLVPPSATPTPLVIPPAAGPQLLPPGVTNVIIAVLIIIAGLGGGFFLLRRGFKPPNQNRPPNPNLDGSDQFSKITDDLNPQPLPPKGMGDGSNQFFKIEDGSPQDAANQWRKIAPDQSEPGPTGGGDQLNKL